MHELFSTAKCDLKINSQKLEVMLCASYMQLERSDFQRNLGCRYEHRNKYRLKRDNGFSGTKRCETEGRLTTNENSLII